jgi:hypothetical protein
MTKQTINKYIVILFGPPASGKTLARKIACYKIKKIFKEELGCEEIFNSFIDTGVDEITYKSIPKNSDKNISELLIENMKKLLEKRDNLDEKTFIKKNINEFVTSSFKIYSENRADIISELLLYFSLYLNKNIFFETSSGEPIYLENLIKIFDYFNYIPILIYPYITNVEILFDRSICRGIKEGRFLELNFLSKSVISNLKNYKKIKKILIDKNNFIIYQYNSSFDNIQSI